MEKEKTVLAETYDKARRLFSEIRSFLVPDRVDPYLLQEREREALELVGKLPELYRTGFFSHQPGLNDLNFYLGNVGIKLENGILLARAITNISSDRPTIVFSTQFIQVNFFSSFNYQHQKKGLKIIELNTYYDLRRNNEGEYINEDLPRNLMLNLVAAQSQLEKEMLSNDLEEVTQ